MGTGPATGVAEGRFIVVSGLGACERCSLWGSDRDMLP
jgi:hypothetical protein